MDEVKLHKYLDQSVAHTKEANVGILLLSGI